MAEITIEPLGLVGSGSFDGKIVRLSESAGAFSAKADVAGRIVLIVKSAAASMGSATFPKVNTRIIKYVKTSVNSKSAVAVPSVHKYKTVSGALLSEGLLETYTYDRDVRQTMKDYMPKYYEDLADVMRMVETEANEVTRVQAKLNELLDQFYVNTATKGLNRWESLTDIEQKAARSTDSRRHFINAKLRGVGTVTRELINEIVDSFYGATIEEVPDEMAMKIKITSRRGVPKNFEDIERSVEDVMPAHIGTDFSFSFLPWHELDMIRQQWADISVFKMADVAEKPWREFEGSGARWRKVAGLTAEQLEESYDLNKGGITG
ncbi:putative phage tail protein [Psychrobacillus sp. OK032]|uniref:putative phage tail protein n=1 Tax=Psychrobacillus sp. OK032 TaxID=1884358 RepID=UPI0008B5FF72|nr:putative phage tail protein [Psychrobacillus sp. OK032]SER87141.1 hypothetical protein SAMN05518872_102422 [Psychrobacillus sp. OK032]